MGQLAELERSQAIVDRRSEQTRLKSSNETLTLSLPGDEF